MQFSVFSTMKNKIYKTALADDGELRWQNNHNLILTKKCRDVSNQ